MTSTDRHELDELSAAIQHAAHLLPSQGPISVFIHHNTLHAFEEQCFEEAVKTGAHVFGCEPYLTEDRYRSELARGRIRFEELDIVLRQDLGARSQESIEGLATRHAVRLAMLQHPLRSGGGIELDWFMAETDALLTARRDVSEVQRLRLMTETRHWVMRRLRGAMTRPAWAAPLFQRFQETRIEDWDDSQWEAFTLHALWEICVGGVRLAGTRPTTDKPLTRHRDVIVAAGGSDSDLLINDVLIRVCAAFLDQGLSHWHLPQRERGLFVAFCELYAQRGTPVAWWMRGGQAADGSRVRGLREELCRLRKEGVSALECLRESLALLGVSPDERQQFLSATLLALRGWGGMIWHIEERSDRAERGVPQGSLIEFLAVRLLLERFALPAAAQTSLDYEGDLARMRDELTTHASKRDLDIQKPRAFLIFQLAQILGWTPERLEQFNVGNWGRLLAEIEGFDELSRRRVFHLAYEHRFRVRTLEALAAHGRESARRDVNNSASARPQFQAVFCIDEREESIRRHLEEVEPAVETFGVAGFFGVVMYYRGAAAASFVPLCPVVVRPQHWVSETVEEEWLAEHERRRKTRRRVGMALQAFHGGSRRIVSGAFYAATIGLLTTIPLVARVLFPRLAAKFQGYFDRFISPPPKTRLILERQQTTAAPEHESQHGFVLSEMIDIGERLLRDIGLTQSFARCVFLIGHGSTSVNNPHESAHDCGACGGNVGGPNARAAALMLNDPRVQNGLRERGIVIPPDTIFVGGLHDTSSDDLTFADADRVPASHRSDFDTALSALHEAAVRNAHERSRRFQSVSLEVSLEGAKWHMEGRAEDLSQVRPEYGHATNAICMVGRRSRTRGLFLDRRSFLVSYDPQQDDVEHTILARILGAVVPVCSGINLEYYFSSVDSPGWGAGTKLPHNITGLLGVMDGPLSDLRTGLPLQMVDVHEPVRLLFVIEALPETLLSIMDRNPAVKATIVNRWVQLALMNPETGALCVYREGVFETHQLDASSLPIAASSREWYSGWRESLDFAQIVPP